VSDPDFIIALMMGTHEEFGDYESAITAKTTIDTLAVATFTNQLIREDELRRKLNARGASHNEKRVLTMKIEFRGI